MAACAAAADWPTYRHDNARSGTTPQPLPAKLGERWVFRPAHPPSPAWSDPQPIPIEGIREYPRVRFDDAFHVAAAHGCVYFGSSSDNAAYCLDARSGRLRWRFDTGGAIRLAPTVADGRVYVGSDDGCVYCFDRGGRVLWRFRAGRSRRRLLGRGKMISLWPVRTGVVVDSGVAYFGAGLFPSEGLLLHAVDAATGKGIWRNDSLGRGGLAGLSPQGYMLCSKDRLYVVSGRAGPAAFDRKTGRRIPHRNLVWRRIGVFGGTLATLAGDHLFSGTQHIVAYGRADLKVGHAFIPGRRLVVTKDRFFVLDGRRLTSYDRKTYPAASRKRNALIPRIPAKHKTRRLIRLWRRDLTAAEKNEKRAQQRIKQIEKELGAAGKGGREKGARAAELRKQLAAAKSAKAKAAAKAESVRKEIAKGEKQVAAVESAEKAAADAVRRTVRWQIDCKHTDAMILAGDTLCVGGAGEVLGVKSATGKEAWRHAVRGKARGLAVADGRLLVSTDGGEIVCFAGGEGEPAAPRVVTQAVKADPYEGRRAYGDFPRIWAERIVKSLPARRGYALILGGAGGEFASELARRTALTVYLVEPDAERAASARKALGEAGLLGRRVCVEQAPLDKLPYSNYFANLIVCLEPLSTGKAPSTPAAELVRMLKPMGGAAAVGYPVEALAGDPGLTRAALQAWLEPLGEEPGVKAEIMGRAWARIDRGALPGAGRWTHEYGEPGNTGCSDDRRVVGPLGLLWFGEPGPTRMPSRHGSAPAPLAMDGRLFVQIEDAILALDAYNGVKLWETPIKNAVRERLYGTGTKMDVSNLACGAGSVFVAVGDRCYRLDAATGEIGRTYRVPASDDGEPRRWGYVAVVGGLLFGSRTRNGRVSDCVFALDADSGRMKWTHSGKDLMHISIAIGGGRVYLVDRAVGEAERRRALAERPTPSKPRKDRRGRPVRSDVRLVKALDMETGRLAWKRGVDVCDCVKIGRTGGELTVLYSNEVLLLCGQPWNGHFWREFLSGQFSRRSIIALSAGDGRRLWSGRKGYRSRPIVVGQTIYAEPWAYDLYSGEAKTREHPLTGRREKWQMSRPGHHCGCIAAGPNHLFFRSGSLGYYDLRADSGTSHFGAYRPGCWINFIPANGLVLVPEASSGCVCPFSMQTTVALYPRRQDRAWNIYSAAGAMTPVRRWAINLGAPGDRRAADGTLWLGYPRPRAGRLALTFDLKAKLLPNGRYYAHDPEATRVRGAAVPWVYTYGVRGLSHCTLPLYSRKDKGGGLYTVRLHFAETVQTPAGRRVFAIKLQGKRVAEAVDVAAEAGGAGRALVREFKDVPVALGLRIELEPRAAKPKPEELPILSGIEVIRTQTVPDMPKPPKPATAPAKKDRAKR